MEEIVIIGGGVSGISSAVILAENGFKPILIESRKYLGGRVRSFINELSGDVIDNGQHLFLGCYNYTFKLFRKLDTFKFLVKNFPSNIEFRDRYSGISNLSYPAIFNPQIGSMLAILKFKNLSIKEKLLIFPLINYILLNDVNPNETVKNLLDRFKQSSNICYRLWNPIVIATINSSPELASASLFVNVMKEGFLGKGNSSLLYFSNTGLSNLFINSTKIIENSSGKVLYNSSVSKIFFHNSYYRIVFKDNSEIKTKNIISSVSSDVLSRIINDDKILKSSLNIPEFKYSPIISIYIWFKGHYNLPLFNALTGTRIEWLFNKRKMFTENKENTLISCTISSAEELSKLTNTDLYNIVIDELKICYKELKNAEVLDFEIIKENRATPIFTPEAQRMRLKTKTILKGFYLSGDWTDTKLPATIEGGVKSGFKAAELFLKDCK